MSTVRRGESGYSHHSSHIQIVLAPVNFANSVYARWAVLRLAVDPTAQVRLHADLQQRKRQSGSGTGGSSSSSSDSSSIGSTSTGSYGSGNGNGSGSGGAVKSFGPLFLTAAAACARDCPVSAAVGPPRKLTQDLIFQGYALPAEAICFAMHPGLRAGAAAGTGSDAAPWSSSISGEILVDI